MQALIVGDVHACYHSFKKMVKNHWQADAELLVLVGDLINKGPHSAKCLLYWRKLVKRHPGKVILLRGNHEQWFIDHYLAKSKAPVYRSLVEHLAACGLSADTVKQWLQSTPLSWQTPEVLVTHAGISPAAKDPFDVHDEHGVLRNRKVISHLKQMQVVGHTVVKENRPLFVVSENAWYIDTGAWNSAYLSALRFRDGQSIPRIVQVPTSERDRMPYKGQAKQA